LLRLGSALPPGQGYHALELGDLGFDGVGHGGANAMRTPSEFEGKLVRGAHALPIVRGFRKGTVPHTEGGKGGAMEIAQRLGTVWLQSH
jgi:hypothetical protein